MEPADAALVTAFFCQLRKVAQRLSCYPPCFLWSHPFGDLFLHKVLKVEGEFLTELRVQRIFFR